MEDGEVLASFPLDGEPKDAYSHPVTAMVFSPDGEKLAVASPSGREGWRIDLYDAATGRLEVRIEQDDSLWFHWPGSLSLAFTPDGARIVAAQTDTSALVGIGDGFRLQTMNEDGAQSLPLFVGGWARSSRECFSRRTHSSASRRRTFYGATRLSTR